MSLKENMLKVKKADTKKSTSKINTTCFNIYEHSIYPDSFAFGWNSVVCNALLNKLTHFVLT